MRWTALSMLLAAAGLAVPGPAAAADWPQYRGPERDGVSAETGLAESWPDAGPPVLWRVPLGDGYSGISAAGGRLYTLMGSGGDEVAVCLDAATGEEIWRRRIDANRKDGMGDGPRSTPTVEGGVAYVLGARGKLLALKAADGEVLWQKDLPAEFGARVPQWGVSGSPLVEGNLLLLDVGGRSGHSVMALDRKTGEAVWASQSGSPGYASPLAVTIHGTRQVLFFTAAGLLSVAPGDGALLWRVPWQTSYDVNAAMPVFLPPDKVFISSSYDTGAALYRIQGGGRDLRPEEVWRSRVMKNHFNSSVHYKGHLYGFDDATLKCIDPRTGQEKWAARGFGKGSLLAADGRLFVLGEKGQLALVVAVPDAYRELARAQPLEGKTWTMPTLSDGRLFLRNEAQMVALVVAKR